MNKSPNQPSSFSSEVITLKIPLKEWKDCQKSMSNLLAAAKASKDLSHDINTLNKNIFSSKTNNSVLNEKDDTIETKINDLSIDELTNLMNQIDNDSDSSYNNNKSDVKPLPNNKFFKDSVMHL